jgi:hypothetical protein
VYIRFRDNIGTLRCAEGKAFGSGSIKLRIRFLPSAGCVDTIGRNISKKK